jgi:hypothetical protein
VTITRLDDGRIKIQAVRPWLAIYITPEQARALLLALDRFFNAPDSSGSDRVS